MTEDIFKQEEKAILLSVDKAKASSNNSQTIGRNGEVPFIEFLNNYLPPNLKAVSGHFITPSKKRSPQIDCLIVDTRFPLLGYNSDDTVLVMAHSVLKIIELKTNLTRKDLEKTANNFQKIRVLLKSIWEGTDSDWKGPRYKLITYNISTKFDTVAKAYFELCDPELNHFDIGILRTNKDNDSGAFLHFEPMLHKDLSVEQINTIQNSLKKEYLLTSMPEKTPLSDIYYSLIQNSYSMLDYRDLKLGEIANLFDDYINWSTYKSTN